MLKYKASVVQCVFLFRFAALITELLRLASFGGASVSTIMFKSFPVNVKAESIPVIHIQCSHHHHVHAVLLYHHLISEGHQE